MTPNNDKPNFLDRGTLLAFALILLFWFGWSKFMESRYPAQNAQSPEVVKEQVSQPAGVASPHSKVEAKPSTAAAVAPSSVPSEEKFFVYEDENLAFRLSSSGMGLSDINVKKYLTRDGQPIILGAVNSDYPFSTLLIENNQPIAFQIEKTDESTFVGRGSVGGLIVEKTLKVDSSKYSIESQIKVTGDLAGFKGIATRLSDPAIPQVEGGFLQTGASEHQEWFILHESTKTRKVIAPKDGLQMTEGNASIAALSSHYFTLAVADQSEVLPAFVSNMAPGSPIISGQLNYVPLAKNDSFNLKYTAVAGPKSYNVLTSINENLGQVVDYGMFGALGKPILWLLKYLYSIFANWGWAIVVLTIIVRAIVLPFNAYAFKSMKAMQKIQPEMNRIKERYKDKPAEARLQMNQEIMQLMKTHKASPVGGCLPTLLQLPVFFALYQVLGQSIELYRAPFILWIHDLSSKDPYFVLPVLMGITMFLQQKLTPTTMDPQQAKILQWMPVIFSVFMLSLPSGLTLYIFVSTLFGILQQYYFMKDKSKPASGRVKEAKA